MRFKAVVLCCAFAAPAFAWDTPRNPDLRPSFGFEAGGGADLHATQDLTLTETGPRGRVLGTDAETRDLSGHTGQFVADALFPLNDRLSVQGGGGITTTVDRADALALLANKTSVSLANTTTDTSLATAFMSLRYYFLDCNVGHALTDNPDQWPSLALRISGNDSIYRNQTNTATNGATSVARNSRSYLIGGGIDARVPLAEAWTLLVYLDGANGQTDLPEKSNAAGDDSQLTTLAYGGGAKYYWVNQNLIRDDHHENPDRWISLAFTVAGTHATHGQETLNETSGVVDQRDLSLSGFNTDAELRLPLSNSVTFRLGVGGGQTTLSAPQVGNNNPSVKTKTTFLNAFAGVRAYIL